MKELSIEQKAQRYDKAIERAKSCYSITTPVADTELIELIFPELKESEDERIRKELLEHCRKQAEMYNTLLTAKEYSKVQSWIAWLEKQGKNNMGISEATKRELENNLHEALEKETPESCNEFLEKQGEQEHVIAPKFDIGDTIRNKITNEVFTITDRCISLEYYHDINHLHEIKFSEQDNWELVEQKPAWSEEDDIMIHDIDYALRGQIIYPISKLQSLSNWILNLKDRVQSQSKQEWNEEDENRINRLIAYFEDKESFTAEDDIIYANWLKSLKDRFIPQVSKEWSEEDVNNLNRISVILNDARQVREWWKDERLITKEESDKLITFLKSLRPQNTWKPSDKQLNNILDVLSFDNCTPKRRELLESLYNDLNKLRGE